MAVAPVSVMLRVAAVALAGWEGSLKTTVCLGPTAPLRAPVPLRVSRTRVGAAVTKPDCWGLLSVVVV